MHVFQSQQCQRADCFSGLPRVGILFTGTDEELLASEKVLRAFLSGDIAELTYQIPIISTGILLGRPESSSWDIFLSQNSLRRRATKSSCRAICTVRKDCQCSETKEVTAASIRGPALAASVTT